MAEKLNEVMIDYFSKSKHFATMALVGIELATGEACYINAGHRNIFVKNKNGAHPLISQGSILGMNRDAQYFPRLFRLLPDDILMLYTDGLVENHINNYGLYKFKALAEKLERNGTINGIKNQIWKPITLAGSSQVYQDDMTLLLIQFKQFATQRQIS